MNNKEYVLGAVAYDPKVVTIWEGFRSWFYDHDFPFDFVLYSNYERQVEELVEGRIDVAWNSPLAWIRADRLARSQGLQARAIAMRDTDQDLRSIVVVKADSPYASLGDLAGQVVATGAVDSPQATLIPIGLFAKEGIDPTRAISVRRFDVGVGLHGDHVGGEREAAQALMAGEVAASCMIDANFLAFTREGTLAGGACKVLAETAPYDHCNMTVIDRGTKDESTERFWGLLSSMDYADNELRPLLDLEGVTKWLPGRTSGYGPLEQAVDSSGFYDRDGALTASDYRP